MSRTIELYASAPGLLLMSPEVAAELRSSEDEYATRHLYETGRLVQIQTGSPQLDYVIDIHEGGVTPNIDEAAADSVTFPFVVTGNALEVRDGYVTLDWSDESDYACERVDFPDGCYTVNALWVRSAKHGEMVIHLFLQRADTVAQPCEGSVELDYDAT